MPEAVALRHIPTSLNKSRVWDQWLPTLFGMVLGLLVVGPWIHRGRLELLDFVSGPHMSITPSGFFGLNGGLVAGLPFDLTRRVLDRLIGADAPSLLVLCFFPLAATSITRLTGGSRVERLSAAALYLINPFVFDRIFAGQIAFLLGYSILPLFVRAVLVGGLRSIRSAVVVGLWLGLLVAMSVHFLWIGAVVLLAYAVSIDRGWRAATGAVAAIGVAALVSLYLLVPSLAHQLPVAVGGQDLVAFRTRSYSHLGIPGTVLSLRGFWRQGPSATDLSKGWPFFLVALVGLVAVGAIHGLRERRDETRLLVVSGGLAFMLALGTWGPAGPLYRALYHYVPYFAVMREPGKFGCLLCLTYAVLFARGAEALSQRPAKRPRYRGWVLVAILLPLAYSPTIFWGLGGSVRASRPSPGWSAADKVMGNGPEQILFLPWHQYVALPFTDRRVVANPAPDFFRRRVISGDNIELPGVYSETTLQRSRFLQQLFVEGPRLQNAGARLATIGVKFVVLARTADAGAFTWLGHQDDLMLVLHTPELDVWQTVLTQLPAYSLPSLWRVHDLAPLFAGSQATHVGAVLGGSAPQLATADPPKEALSVAIRRRGPTEYELPAQSSPWSVVTEPFQPGWRIGHGRPVQLANGTMAFRRRTAARATMRYGPWNWIAAAYGLSVAVAGGLTLDAIIANRKNYGIT